MAGTNTNNMKPTEIDPVTEAMENLQYWRRQAAIRENKDSRNTAKALATAWKTTLAARIKRAQSEVK